VAAPGLVLVAPGRGLRDVKKGQRLSSTEREGRSLRDDDGAGLGLPVGVDDGALLVADVLPVPLPCLGVDGLSNGSNGAEGAEVVSLGVLLAEAAKETNGGGGSVEL
jgi:hypothetical protein